MKNIKFNMNLKYFYTPFTAFLSYAWVRATSEINLESCSQHIIMMIAYFCVNIQYDKFRPPKYQSLTFSAKNSMVLRPAVLLWVNE